MGAEDRPADRVEDEFGVLSREPGGPKPEVMAIVLLLGCLSPLPVICIMARIFGQGFNAVPELRVMPSKMGLRANLYPSGWRYRFAAA